MTTLAPVEAFENLFRLQRLGSNERILLSTSRKTFSAVDVN